MKYSAPGWTKHYTSNEELKQELARHICGLCRAGTDEPSWPSEPCDLNDIDSMLSTSCGCEYGVEE